MYHPGGTIKDAVDSIASRKYVLPAIQREFVWDQWQICALFDSLMQGYPFGELLFWQIEPENSGKYRYYDFVREYHERDNPHCPDLGDFAEQTTDSSAGWSATVDRVQYWPARGNGRQATPQVEEQPRCVSPQDFSLGFASVD